MRKRRFCRPPYWANPSGTQTRVREKAKKFSAATSIEFMENLGANSAKIYARGVQFAYVLSVNSRFHWFLRVVKPAKVWWVFWGLKRFRETGTDRTHSRDSLGGTGIAQHFYAFWTWRARVCIFQSDRQEEVALEFLTSSQSLINNMFRVQTNTSAILTVNEAQHDSLHCS